MSSHRPTLSATQFLFQKEKRKKLMLALILFFVIRVLVEFGSFLFDFQKRQCYLDMQGLIGGADCSPGHLTKLFSTDFTKKAQETQN